MKNFSTLILLALCSCTFIHMEENLQRLVGTPIEQAFATLGYPDGSFRVRDVDIYTWGRSQSYSYDLPQTGTTYGSFNSFNSPFPTYYQTTTNYNTHHTGTSNCKIKIVADRNGMIIHTEYDGDWVACEAYADRLARY